MPERAATERLTEALLAAGLADDDRMVVAAREGDFDDFKSRRHDLPILALVAHARARGLTDIATRAIAGEFDAAAWEGDAWAASAEGRQVSRDV